MIQRIEHMKNGLKVKQLSNNLYYCEVRAGKYAPPAWYDKHPTAWDKIKQRKEAAGNGETETDQDHG